MSDHSQEPSPEDRKWIHEIQREDAHRAHDRNRDFWEGVNDAAIKAGDSTLRAALLINGGAAVAVLGFLGAIVSQGRITISQLSDVSSSLVFFAYGVTASVVGMALSYLTNYITAVHANSFVHWWQHPYIRPGKNTNKIAAIKIILHIAAVLAGLEHFPVTMNRL